MATRRVAVVTDSTADFAGVTPADLQITVVPLTVSWGSDVLRDRIDVTTPEFYVRLRVDHDMPKTSAPPIGIFEELYANLLTVHEAVVSVHLSAKFSGTYGVACAAANAVNGARVHVIPDELAVEITPGTIDVRLPAAALPPGQMSVGVGITVVAIRVGGGVDAPRPAVVVQPAQVGDLRPGTSR